MKYLSIIEEYYLGKLQGQSLQDFIIELEKNPEMKNEFEIYKKALDFSLSNERQLISDISQLRDFKFDSEIFLDIKKYVGKEPLNADEEEIMTILQEKTIKSKKVKVTKKFYIQWFKVASIIIIVVSLGISGRILCSKKPDSNELFQRFYAPYNYSFNSRSLNSDIDRTILECLDFYDKKNFKDVIQKLSIIPDSLKENSELAIIEAISFIELKKYNESLKVLDLINNNSLLYTTSLWYKGLCYLKLNNNKNAKKVFQELNSFEPFYKDQTRKLLKAL